MHDVMSRRRHALGAPRFGTPRGARLRRPLPRLKRARVCSYAPAGMGRLMGTAVNLFWVATVSLRDPHRAARTRDGGPAGAAGTR